MAITIDRLRQVLSDLNGAQLSEVEFSLIKIENLLPQDVSKALFIDKLIKICSEELEKKHSC